MCGLFIERVVFILEHVRRPGAVIFVVIRLFLKNYNIWSFAVLCHHSVYIILY